MRQPDRNAPRYRYSFKQTLNPEFIREFKKKYPQYDQYSNESLINALKLHNKAIREQVINTRDGIELQADLGNVFVGMVKAKKKIAWKQSVQLGVKVYHQNHETDGKTAKIFYTNYGSKYKFEHRHLWKLTACRTFAHTVSINCAKNWSKYVNLDSNYKIWELFDKRLIKGRALTATKKSLVEYNEFEI